MAFTFTNPKFFSSIKLPFVEHYLTIDLPLSDHQLTTNWPSQIIPAILLSVDKFPYVYHG